MSPILPSNAAHIRMTPIKKKSTFRNFRNALGRHETFGIQKRMKRPTQLSR